MMGKSSLIEFLFACLNVLGWGSESAIFSYGMKDEDISHIILHSIPSYIHLL